MTDYADIALVVLAAGQGMRFGSDKLMADIDGTPMGLHITRTLAPMTFGWRIAVAGKGSALVQHFSAAGFDVIANKSPEKGQAHSLHLAVKAATAMDAKALLVVLADMPFVSADHIAALVAGCHDDIVASSDGIAPMPPVIFPREVWPELLATSGDFGARDLLHDAKLVTAPLTELRDIDVPADLRETHRQ